MTYQNSAVNPTQTIIGRSGDTIVGGGMRALAFDESGELIVSSSDQAPMGIALPDTEETVEIGTQITVAIKDIALWMSGGEFAPGDPIASDAAGYAVKAQAGAFIMGYALEAANTSGDIVPVQITKSGYQQ